MVPKLDWSKPVVLLDFDGVLNSISWFGKVPKKSSSFLGYHKSLINPVLAKKVAGLIRDYDCSVIVCSSFRITLSDAELQELLSEHGIPFHGSTPFSSEHRTVEIQDYVSRFPEGSRWIVIDDSVDPLEFEGHVVRPRDGLVDEDFDRARELLDRQA